jgi:6,7-dimethyl-8-ribityllumazine synthase
MAEPSRPAAPRFDVGGARFLIVEARFYDAIGALLLEGATQALTQANARYEVVSVPGALEVASAIAIALEAPASSRPIAGVVALGCVLRGETYHFEVVSNESARALMDMSISRRLPLGNGILTVDTEEQALVRADPARGDKGGDAARAALALYVLKHRLGTL